MDTPITLLQDLQGPKIRVGKLQGDQIQLIKGEVISIIPMEEYTGQPDVIPIDYPHAASEAKSGMSILLDDGLLSLVITEIKGNALICMVVDGGILKTEKGSTSESEVNTPLPDRKRYAGSPVRAGTGCRLDIVEFCTFRD